MAYCIKNYCCASEVCNNLGIYYINHSSFHRICEYHSYYLKSYPFLQCGYCSSICLITNTENHLNPIKYCSICSLKEIDDQATSRCQDCLNICSSCRGSENIIRTRCNLIICKKCSIRRCCEYSCEVCFTDYQTFRLDCGKIMCQNCYKNSNQINLESYQSTSNLNSEIPKLDYQNKTIHTIDKREIEEVKKNLSAEYPRCHEESNIQQYNNSSSFNKCNISMNESLKCVKCNTNSTQVLKCDHCFNGYCPTCMQKHELQLKNPNSCSECSVSQDTQKLNCDHIFCSNCLDSSNEACSICHPIHATCTVCARKGFQKMKFKYCIDIGCKSCKIYDFCYACISSMDQNALKINIKFEKLNINCQVCEKTKDHLIEMICKHFVCLSCLKNIENYDYLCLNCYEQSSTMFCVRCKINYELEFLEGSIYKSCCSTLIREKRSFKSIVKNLFMR